MRTLTAFEICDVEVLIPYQLQSNVESSKSRGAVISSTSLGLLNAEVGSMQSRPYKVKSAYVLAPRHATLLHPQPVPLPSFDRSIFCS